MKFSVNDGLRSVSVKITATARTTVGSGKSKSKIGLLQSSFCFAVCAVCAKLAAANSAMKSRQKLWF
jgi:hypothetical protein